MGEGEGGVAGSALGALLEIQFAMLAASRHASNKRSALRIDFGGRHLMDLSRIKHFLKRWVAAQSPVKIGDTIRPSDAHQSLSILNWIMLGATRGCASNSR